MAGLEELSKLGGQYRLVINGSAVSATILLTPRDLETFAEYIDEMRGLKSDDIQELRFRRDNMCC